MLSVASPSPAASLPNPSSLALAGTTEVLAPSFASISAHLSKTPVKSYLPPLVADVLRSYIVLAEAEARAGTSGLSPSEPVNRAFEKLVSIATLILPEGEILEIIDHPLVVNIISHLRSLCSQGEGALEAYWSRKLCVGVGSQCRGKELSTDITSFPYYENYVDITRLELGLIRAATSRSDAPCSRFAFVGCGPLPLTSFCIYDQVCGQPGRGSEAGGAKVHILNVDCSASAVELACHLSKAHGYSDTSMEFACDVAGGSKHNLLDRDVVYLAALVGESGDDKREILASVVRRMKIGSLLVIRTAWGLRKLLYPELAIPGDLAVPGLEIVSVAHPYDSIVNSIIVARVVEIQG